MFRTAIVMILALVALSACETMQGVGQDMQDAGQAVETEAQQAQTGG